MEILKEYKGMNSPTIWDRCDFDRKPEVDSVPVTSSEQHKWPEGVVVPSREVYKTPKVSKPIGVYGFLLTTILSIVCLVSGGIGVLFMTGVYVGSVWFLLTTGGAATLAVFVIIALLL